MSIGLTRRVNIDNVRKLAGALAIRELTVAFDGFVDGTTLYGTQRPQEDQSLDEAIQRLRKNLLFDLEPRKTDEEAPGERVGPKDTPERQAAIETTKQRIQSGELPIAAIRLEGSAQSIRAIAKDPLVHSISLGQSRAILPLDAASRRVEDAAC